MKHRIPLRLDLNNLFQPSLADGPEDLTSFEPLFIEAHKAIMAMKETGHLTFALLPEDEIMRESIEELAAKYPDVQNVLVFGIGGSALGTMSLQYALFGPLHQATAKISGKRRLFVVDFIEPWSLDELFTHISGEKNLYIFISKSGNTSETLAQYLYVRKVVPNIRNEDIIVITDPKEGLLRKLAVEQNLVSLQVPSGVGGRFSIFSPVGLFPLALMSVDLKELLSGAAHMERACRLPLLAQNPAALLACSLHFWLRDRKLTQIVMLPYSDRLRLFADWFAQLWAESLGKRFTTRGKEVFTGTTPIKSLGVADQHSQLQLYLDGPRDKVTIFVNIEDRGSDLNLAELEKGDERIDFLMGRTLSELINAERIASEECLRENQRPNLTIGLSQMHEYQMGQLYQLFMNVIPYMGIFNDINAYDQPAVERIKEYTFGLMGKKGFERFARMLKERPRRKDLEF